jgi:ubiquinone/menaquinone biosynthesis C-methylase UbiE
MIDDNRAANNKGAVTANEAFFNEALTQKYASIVPHLKYSRIRNLYGQLVRDVFAHAQQYTEVPNVLDLGAGEGSATLPFLELGAKVIAVDVSESQLSELRRKCASYKDRLEIRQVDINEALQTDEHYDVLVMSSCLHHIPDYVSALTAGVNVLSRTGQIFSFQDPIRYDTMGTFSRSFNKLVYFSWRVFQGDFVGGVSRTLRRARGIYLHDCPADNVEYHVVRNGVDQDKIVELLSARGFDCRVIRYFSTQGSMFQLLGSALGIKNTFSIIARRQEGHAASNPRAIECAQRAAGAFGRDTSD